MVGLDFDHGRVGFRSWLGWWSGGSRMMPLGSRLEVGRIEDEVARIEDEVSSMEFSVRLDRGRHPLTHAHKTQMKDGNAVMKCGPEKGHWVVVTQ